MEDETRVLRWDAGRIEKLLPRFLAPISGGEMIGAANAIQGAADIALAKPPLADRIAREILKVSHARYQRPECRNVAAGHAIQSLDRFFQHIRKQKPVLAFVQAELANSRPATRRKAEKFCKKWA